MIKIARQSERSEEELAKERKIRKDKLLSEASQSLADVIAKDSEPTERETGKQFNRMVDTLRKGLLHLRKQKQAKIKTYSEVYDEALELIGQFVEE